MPKYLAKSTNNPSTSNKYALFIGRWQPFHAGHQWLIDQQLKHGCGKVCIGIRDVEKSENNPWSATTIKEDICKKFAAEIKAGTVKVIIIPDIESINIGREVGYDIIEHIPPADVSNISGTKIRNESK